MLAADVRRRARAPVEGTDAALPRQQQAESAEDERTQAPCPGEEPDYYPPEEFADDAAAKRIDDSAPARHGRPGVERMRWSVLLAFVVLGVASRLFRIARGDFVVWDEAHFGKFASYYLTRAFYFDVHPPLGKMLVAAAGWLAGWDGTGFDFGSGKKYDGHVDYVAMRVFVALFGAAVVPLTYVTALQLRMRHATAVLTATMVLLESGLIGISRLILLDAFLLCFTALTICGYATFRNQRPFSAGWHGALLVTGVGIGCVSSVKWVGFFPTALVGLLTIEELVGMLHGPGRVPRLRFLAHFGARALFLIAVPVAIYVGSFAAHFAVLSRSGTGDGNMSSLFQAGLAGSDLSRNPVRVVYGSAVTLKSGTYGGGLLHSHVQRYPGGSGQQQVTTYHHKDANNVWVVVPAALLSGDTVAMDVAVRERDLGPKPAEAEGDADDSGEEDASGDAKNEARETDNADQIAGKGGQQDNNEAASDPAAQSEGGEIRAAKIEEQVVPQDDDAATAENVENDADKERGSAPSEPKVARMDIPVEYAALTDVVDGAVVRLMHKATGAMLHSHATHAAPLTSEDREVTGYGRIGLADANDLWRVEVARELAADSTERNIRALTTSFRLRHVATGCYLRARNVQLPEWGFKQGEVSCAQADGPGAPALLWNVETHVNDLLPEGAAGTYRSRFVDDLRDINVGMWVLNNALTPDPELEPGQLVSRASDWFAMRRGIRMCAWADDAVRFYMLGSPAVWWGSSLGILAAGALLVYAALVSQRGEPRLLPAHWTSLSLRLRMTAGGWALVYLPFFVMGRVLYVHHYYPAILFAVLCLGVLLDAFVVRRLRTRRAQALVCLALGAAVLASFAYFAPLCYGMEGPARAFHGRRWLRSWNL